MDQDKVMEFLKSNMTAWYCEDCLAGVTGVTEGYQVARWLKARPAEFESASEIQCVRCGRTRACLRAIPKI